MLTPSTCAPGTIQPNAYQVPVHIEYEITMRETREQYTMQDAPYISKPEVSTKTSGTALAATSSIHMARHLLLIGFLNMRLDHHV